jgi:hypothetical protein
MIRQRRVLLVLSHGSEFATNRPRNEGISVQLLFSILAHERRGQMESSDPKDQGGPAPVSERVDPSGTLFGYSKSAVDQPEDKRDEVDGSAPE